MTNDTSGLGPMDEEQPHDDQPLHLRLLNVANDPAVRLQADAQAVEEPLEVVVGDHFARTRCTEFKYNASTGKWAYWDGARWNVDVKKYTLNEMTRFTDRVRRLDPGNRKHLGTFMKNVHCLAQASTHRDMACESKDFDSRSTFIGTPEGYVDLDTGEHREPDASLLISKCTSVAPSETAECPRWLEFLSWATGGDEEVLDYLQRFFGYSLSGLMNEEIMTFLYGPGGNGKGVMISVLGKIFGDYYKSTPSSTFMETRHQEHSTELARLDGVRLVTASETNEKDKWNVSRIKEITGNENPIAARYMRQDFFEFWPVCKLMIIGNSKPRLDNVDPAITRRMRMIEFTQTPQEVDNHLKTSFDAELPAILRWVIDGFAKYREHGLKAPEAVAAASKTYLGEQDTTRQFIDEWLEVRPKGVLLKKDIKLAGQAWLELNGVNGKIMSTRLSTKLKEMYPGAVREGQYKNLKCLEGVNLTTEAWEQYAKWRATRLNDPVEAEQDGRLNRPVGE